MLVKIQPAAVAADSAVLVLYSPESSPCVGMRQPAPKAVHCDDTFDQFVSTPVILVQVNDPPPFNAQPAPDPVVPPVALWVWIYPDGNALTVKVLVV